MKEYEIAECQDCKWSMVDIEEGQDCGACDSKNVKYFKVVPKSAIQRRVADIFKELKECRIDVNDFNKLWTKWVKGGDKRDRRS